MLKCPMLCCPVIVAPEKGLDDLHQQKGALMRHLTGEAEESRWFGCEGHSLDHSEAAEIAELVVQLTTKVVEVSR